MKVLVVGGGVAGLACAQRLARRRDGVEVTLIDAAMRHDFAPSFLWLMTGERAPEQVSRSLAPLARAGVQLLHGEVTAVDPAAGTVSSTVGAVDYDQLVLAPGAALAAEQIPGMADEAHGFYTRQDAERLRDALATFGGGRVLIVVAAMPFKCPAAPYEAAFLVEDLLRRRGTSARVDVITAEPQPLPVAGEQIGAQVTAMLVGRGKIGRASCRERV